MSKCRHCGASLQERFLDLGHAPPSNAYRTEAQLDLPEICYPLRLYVCTRCWLVQTQDFAHASELFNESYAYFSSTSESWLAHARRYSRSIIDKLALGPKSFVVELASNDGYLLRNFVDAGVPCLGIEPTASTAAAAEAIGIPVLREFFGVRVARELANAGKSADLVIGNNVLAHVPDVNDFVAGMASLLKDGGTITLEFPHLMRLVEHAQFDTVYHEHFSYFSLFTTQWIFERAGLRIYDVEELDTHGGSLRIYACHSTDSREESPRVPALIREEERQGLRTLEPYRKFQSRINCIKNDLLVFLLERKRAGDKVVAYGAAAKGNTLLNYAGVKPDLLPFVCDAAVSKQNKYLPGSGIRILAPEALVELKPAYVLVLPWNIAHEVIRQQFHVREWGGRFVAAIPKLHYLD